jgi:diacylglycerol kinase (ATP)
MTDAASSDGLQQQHRFTFTGRLRSVRFALIGIRTMLASQHNAWVHTGGTVAVITAGLVLRVGRVDWCLLILAMMAVWTAEALNTAFEFLCDVASPEFHPMVAKSKDVAAGAVLISAIGAVGVGMLVFIPALGRSLGW